MPRFERTPTLTSVMQAFDRRLGIAERSIGRAQTQLITDLSVTGIGTSAKTIASFDFLAVQTCVVEIFAVFTAAMSGAGRSVSVTAPLDAGSGSQILNFTSTSSTTLITQHGGNTGGTNLGGFVVRHWNVAAGKHTITFKATGTGSGVNESLTDGQIAYRII